MADSTNYLESMEDRVDSINSCEALAEAQDSITSELAAFSAGITDQLNILAALITPPSANLGAIVSWITTLISSYTSPYNALLAEQIVVNAKIASILAKLSAKSSSLSCDLPPPSLP